VAKGYASDGFEKPKNADVCPSSPVSFSGLDNKTSFFSPCKDKLASPNVETETLDPSEKKS
jgi:hypothetical protein